MEGAVEDYDGLLSLVGDRRQAGRLLVARLWTLGAATDPCSVVGAVVSRGGRPDLVGPLLAAVRSATLPVVGGAAQLPAQAVGRGG
ncbi:MAG: hypothetical protein M0Z82_13735 [Actinomycetota bacterium]|nr:hypothetical protein [Actinomycetota bacterium]